MFRIRKNSFYRNKRRKYAIIVDEYIEDVLKKRKLEYHKDHDSIGEAKIVDENPKEGPKIELKYKGGRTEKLRPGKALRKIIVEKILDHELGDVVNEMVTYYKMEILKEKYTFRIVGNVPRFYAESRTIMENELGKSCMIYTDIDNEYKFIPRIWEDKDTKDKLDWYRKNNVKLAILTEGGKVAARCLIWDVSNNPGGPKFPVHDRIYFTKPEIKILMKNYMESNNIEELETIGRKIYFKVRSTPKQHPYFDTMDYGGYDQQVGD